MFLVDATGHIVHANTAGDMMLKRAGVLHAEGGRLIANDPQADQTLADTFATAGNGDAASASRASLCLSLRATESVMSPTCYRYLRCAPTGRRELRCRGCAVCAHGGA